MTNKKVSLLFFLMGLLIQAAESDTSIFPVSEMGGGGSVVVGLTLKGQDYFLTPVGMKLFLVDVHEPSAPKIASSHFFHSGIGTVFVSQEKAFVTSALEGLTVLDLSNPTEMSVLGSLPGVSGRLFVTGNRCYAAQGGVSIYDISDPAQIKLLGSFAGLPFSGFNGGANGISVKGDIAYICATDSGLQVFNISDPKSFKRLGSYTGSRAFSAQIKDTLLIVCASGTPPGLFSIITPESPVPLPHRVPSRDGYTVTFSSNLGFIATPYGTDIVDFGNIDSLRLVGRFDSGGVASTVGVIGNLMLESMPKGINIVDFSNPENLILKGQFYQKGGFERMTVSGDYAYLSGTFYTSIWDITHLGSPVKLSEFSGRSAYAKGQYGYVALWYGNLELWDFLDKSNPKKIKDLFGVGGGEVIGLENTICVTIASTLRVVSISSAPDVTYRDIRMNGSELMFAFNGRYVCLRASEKITAVVDISDLEKPRRTQPINTKWNMTAASIHDSTLFVATDSSIEMFSLGNDSTNAFVATFNQQIHMEGRYKHLDIAGNKIVVADENGLFVTAYSESSLGPITQVAKFAMAIDQISCVGSLAYVTSADGAVIVYDLTEAINSIEEKPRSVRAKVVEDWKGWKPFYRYQNDFLDLLGRRLPALPNSLAGHQ
jgi:hypothetical protein